MEEQGIQVWYESSKVLKLVNLCGTQNASKIVKENWEQGIHVDIKGSNILLKLVNLFGTQSDKQRHKRKMWAR